MRGVEALLFDFDGTLVDSAENITSCFSGALASRDLPAADEALVRSLIGRPLREMFAVVRPEADEQEIDGLVAAYRSVFKRFDPASFRLLPEAARTLAAVGDLYRVAVVTSRTASGTRRILAAHALQAHVQTVVGIEDVTHSKPHPEPLRLALDRMGAEARRAVMVGDTADDIEAGRRAGSMTVGVTTGAAGRDELEAAGADHVIDTLAELRRRLCGPPFIMATDE